MQRKNACVPDVVGNVKNYLHVIIGLIKLMQPLTVCPTCNTPLTLKRTSKGTAFFAHPGISKCAKGESNVHFQAKLLLKYYLLCKGKLHLIRKCPGENCYAKQSHTLTIDVSNVRIELEYNLNSRVRVDIAILQDNIVVALIEVYKTHRTAAGTARDQHSWYELSANKILTMPIDAFVWKLTDARQFACNRKPLCISNLDLASRLGYYRQRYAHIYLQEVHMATQGTYAVFTQPWVNDLPQVDPHLYLEAKRRRCCLRCRKPALKVGFIFCKACYSHIGKATNNIETIRITDGLRLRLQSKYQWLLGVPKADICVDCNARDIVQYYGPRGLCPQCFVSRQYHIDMRDR